MDKEEIVDFISPLSSLIIEQMDNTHFHCGYMPWDLIKGPSSFKHFLIGTIGSDSASARLSGASRYIYTIATGYESR